MRSELRSRLTAPLLAAAAALLLMGMFSSPSLAADKEEAEVRLVYFYPRFRCVSCENVEAFAAEAAASYRGHGHEGIPYSRLAIDDPANAGIVDRYGVVGSSLYLVVGELESGQPQELKKVWFFWEDRDGCISYIHEEIERAFTEGAASGDTGIPLAGIPFLAAFLLGLLTAVSPCPLATNIAAVAYISKNIEDRRKTVMSGVLYTAGRLAAYSLLGLMLVYLGANVVDISGFLRNSAVYYLGPLLILISLVMLDVINLSFLKGGYAARLGERVKDRGSLGAFLLGGIFALSFCPYSAILFFGMLIPLSIETTAGGLYLPAVYAVGTGLPVFMVALAIAFGAGAWAAHVDRVQRWEKYVRKAAGLVFLGVGAYYLVLLVKTLA